MNEQGESQGFLFVVLDDPTAAEQASLALNNHPFDKRHTLSVLTFAEVDRIQTVEGEYQEEALKPFQARVRRSLRRYGVLPYSASAQEHLREWLGDEMGRDQALTLRGDWLSISWLERKGTMTPVEQRQVR